MSGTIIPPGVIQRANSGLSRDDILVVSNTIRTLQESLSSFQHTTNKAQKDLDDKLEAVALAQRNLEVAKAKENHIIESISQGEALLAPSPIRILPTEVLSEIFLHYLDLCLSNHYLQYTTILQTQNLLLRICRRWRQTMISDPRLWRTIPVGHLGNDRSLRGECWEMFEERISRARSTQNLSVAVMINVTDNASQSRFLQMAVELLSRATRFQMEAYHPLELEETLPRPVETIHNLKEVVLGMMDISYGNWVTSLLTHAPNLRSLQCYTPLPKFVPLSCLKRLHCLRLDNLFSNNDIARILDDAPLLAELYVKSLIHSPGPTSAPKKHVRLETFYVDATNFEFLEYFTLPGLRHLSFGRDSVYRASARMLKGLVQWPFDSRVANFFERSKCKLLSLEVVNVCLSPEIIGILQSQESLEMLCCESRSPGATVHNAVLEFLRANLPSLTELHVCVTPDQRYAVREMFAERKKRDYFVALESCSVVVLMGGYTDENQRRIHREFIGGPVGIRLSFR